MNSKISEEGMRPDRGSAERKDKSGSAERAARDERAKLLLKSDRVPSSAEIAHYIAQLTAEMVELADIARLDTLSYFLGMAKMEAEIHAHRREVDET